MPKRKPSRLVAEAFSQDWREVLGPRLRAFRKAKGLTQLEVMERSGVHSVVIGNLEAGRTSNPTLDTLLRLAWVYEIDPKDLFEPIKLETIKR